jgi:large subunit ribosomal protein L40
VLGRVPACEWQSTCHWLVGTNVLAIDCPIRQSSLFVTAMSCFLTPRSLRVAARGAKLPARSYATRNEAAGDPKKEIIRKTLYPSNIRNRTSPTGTWRPDVGRAVQHAIPSVQAHDTIERAWLLHKRHVRKQREAELARKFACMKEAMEELERVDKTLYTSANKEEDPRARSVVESELSRTMKTSEIRILEGRVRGLFPRELRIPADTPSKDGWNYNWKSFPRPL